jgi:hypothetical protein
LAVLNTNRLIRGFEEDVTVHADRELVASRDLDRGLNVQVAPRDLSAGLAEFLADCTSGGLSGVGYVRALWLLRCEISNAAVNMLVRTENPIRRR